MKVDGDTIDKIWKVDMMDKSGNGRMIEKTIGGMTIPVVEMVTDDVIVPLMQGGGGRDHPNDGRCDNGNGRGDKRGERCDGDSDMNDGGCDSGNGAIDGRSDGRDDKGCDDFFECDDEGNKK